MDFIARVRVKSVLLRSLQFPVDKGYMVCARSYFSTREHLTKEQASSSSREKGSDPHNAKSDFSQSSREQFEQRKSYNRRSFDKGQSSTAHERRSIAAKWDNAFFSRVHYEPGMHERYAEAVTKDQEMSTDGDETETVQFAEWFPNWSEDTDTPRHLFHSLSSKKKLCFILERLTKGERRIQFSSDYGSLSMMAQLNIGELMISDAENLLNELGWMTPSLASKIEDVKKMARHVKYDYDID